VWQINKVDLAAAVGASLEVLRRDADLMRSGTGTGRGRGEGDRTGSGAVAPWVFAQVGGRASGDSAAAPAGYGPGMDEIVQHVQAALERAGMQPSVQMRANP
jgi:hypothetical protein